MKLLRSLFAFLRSRSTSFLAVALLIVVQGCAPYDPQTQPGMTRAPGAPADKAAGGYLGKGGDSGFDEGKYWEGADVEEYLRLQSELDHLKQRYKLCRGTFDEERKRRAELAEQLAQEQSQVRELRAQLEAEGQKRTNTEAEREGARKELSELRSKLLAASEALSQTERAFEANLAEAQEKNAALRAELLQTRLREVKAQRALIEMQIRETKAKVSTNAKSVRAPAAPQKQSG